ncbi:GFA family protein [Oleiagrimonas citrea]|uniref:GFA family protein n=1 Tax=Oleiagrimonas citrea TaxID=1665687 RepID=A0A846ZJF1_9GAMM|nr:GFA family protein [Oleiagrimonas citrea]NKZ38116.1 GFA family protein [Oleiagrimonas citrea]
MKHYGGCLCGDVRYEVTGSFENFFLCHCSRCRRDTGSSHAANLFSRTATLRWLNGEENVVVFHLPETRHVRSFCSQCGSALPTMQTHGRETLLVVPAGSLETDVPIRPQGHILMGSRANWDMELEHVPAFEGLPG